MMPIAKLASIYMHPFYNGKRKNEGVVEAVTVCEF